MSRGGGGAGKASTADNNKALMTAIHSESISNVQQALAAGADVNFVHRGEDLVPSPGEGTFTPLYYATMLDAGFSLVKMLVASGADVHTKGAGLVTGRNAYMLAEENENAEVLRFLVERGARPPQVVAEPERATTMAAGIGTTALAPRVRVICAKRSLLTTSSAN